MASVYIFFNSCLNWPLTPGICRPTYTINNFIKYYFKSELVSALADPPPKKA